MTTKQALLDALDSPKDLYKELKSLALFLLERYCHDWEFIENRDDLPDELAVFLMSKATKFEKDKGYNPYNFFTTCSLCYLRQLVRKKKNRDFGTQFKFKKARK